MRQVTDETFEREVLGADNPVVVDFWAPWCGPCKAIEPILEALAGEHGSVEFVRMDVDANPLTAARFGVLALPTATLFAGGEARAAVAGARRRADYECAWAPWLGSEPATQRRDA
jgi:thioredoxin